MTCEGYPGIAHDFEQMRLQRDELVEALQKVVDEFYAGSEFNEDKLHNAILEAQDTLKKAQQ